MFAGLFAYGDSTSDLLHDFDFIAVLEHVFGVSNLVWWLMLQPTETGDRDHITGLRICGCLCGGWFQYGFRFEHGVYFGNCRHSHGDRFLLMSGFMERFWLCNFCLFFLGWQINFSRPVWGITANETNVLIRVLSTYSSTRLNLLWQIPLHITQNRH